MTDTVFDTETLVDPTSDFSRYAHIVKAPSGESVHAAVVRARVEGVPVEALCGWRWIPHRNPEGLDVCPVCLEIYEMYRMSNADLGDAV